jgi:hypothetical protein
MVDGLPSEQELFELAMGDTADPEVRYRLLSYRVAILTKEKEGLEKRMAKLEKAYIMGTGIFWALPVLGLLVGYLSSNWSWLTRPWLRGGPSP